ncbi:MAG: DMT family transporter [Chloroflexi bacterium]|nr:DMT family transporter [Chloroflexota bacterium]
MLEGFLSPSLAVVALSLVAAGSWGTSDFGGGLLGRRAPMLGVLVATQGIGLLIALAIIVARGEPILHGNDLLLSVVAGLGASVGVGALYRGLAVGRMGVVAPVAAVLTALTPAVAGIVLDGLPAIVVLGGMGLAIVAVVVVSAAPGHDDGRPSGLPLAILAGLTLGAMSVLISRIGDEYLLAPLAMIRAVQVAVFVVVILAGRQAWRLPRSTWRLAAFVGTVDLVGNIAFLVAVRQSLATASVLSSLYPVITVLLAATIVRERMTRSHAAGVVLAGIAIALIAGGSSI